MPDDATWSLTPEEAALIERYLDFYRALDRGDRRAESPAQYHFVEVCRCRAKAETVHEVAYFKYRMLSAGRRAESEDESSAIDEIGEGVPKPGWFTDEDWKRMRGQYLSDSD